MTAKRLATTIQAENLFLVCGLGRLGQHCVTALKEFGVSVIAIERELPKSWEISQLPQLLDELIIGDCRQIDILEQARINYCTAVLLVTSDEEVNAQTAITIRHINPTVRIIIRSSQENLNHLLGEQLGNFFASCPNMLANTAFGLAVLQDNIIGFFSLDGQQFKVIKRQITSSDPWSQTYLISELNTKKRKILAYNSALSSQSFHQWEPDLRVLPGDVITYVEVVENVSDRIAHNSNTFKWRKLITSFFNDLPKKIQEFRELNFLRQISNVTGIFTLVLFLLITGTFLFKFNSAKTTFIHSFYTTVTLLLGGFTNVFQDPLQPREGIPTWLELFSLFLTIIGTVVIGTIYAYLTGVILSTKFDLTSNRPAVPKDEHLIIVGLDNIGEGVATFLQKFKQSLVIISLKDHFDENTLPEIPIITGNFKQAISKVNLNKARSLILTTDNEILNLEIALIVRSINPKSHLVIRSSKEGLSHQLKNLLENIEVINTYKVAAAAFAGAAFGENIISLFRLENKTILVTECQVTSNDTINGLLISEFSYGYHVVVILYQSPFQQPVLMPSDDIRLKAGDRIVFFGSIFELKKIELGQVDRTSQSWKVKIIQAFSDDSIFEGANIIARISGCSLGLAREMMNNLPNTLPILLYKHQAYNLLQELGKVIIKAELIAHS